MIATKVTGDCNVPRGETTFQANLDPLRTPEVVLQPIVLSEQAASKWNTRKLPRYSGLGRVAEKGFRKHQWMVSAERLVVIDIRARCIRLTDARITHRHISRMDS